MTSHFYDAVIFYASLVRDLAALGRNYKDADVIAQFYPQYSFYSPVNGEVQMNQIGDRKSSFLIQNYDPDIRRFTVIIWPSAIYNGELTNSHHFEKGFQISKYAVPLLVFLN